MTSDLHLSPLEFRDNMSTSQSANASLSRLRRGKGKPLIYYTPKDNAFLKHNKIKKRKPVRPSRYARTDQIKTRDPAYLATDGPIDDPELQCLTIQDVWSEYHRQAQTLSSQIAMSTMLSSHLSIAHKKCRKIASERDSALSSLTKAQQQIKSMVTMLSSRLDIAHEKNRKITGEHQRMTQTLSAQTALATVLSSRLDIRHEKCLRITSERDSALDSLTTAQQQTKSMTSERDSALDSLTTARQEIELMTSERNAAQIEVQKLRGELEEVNSVDKFITSFGVQGRQGTPEYFPDHWPRAGPLDVVFDWVNIR